MKSLGWTSQVQCAYLSILLSVPHRPLNREPLALNNNDTKTLRIDYNNQWPAAFKFPIEQRLLEHLKKLNRACPLVPAQLRHSVDNDFHLMLSSLLDALDMLPLRPDRAFESVWTALDAEMFDLVDRLQPANSPSRFQVLMQHIEQKSAGDASLASMITLMDQVPMQSCEYVATRILEAMHQPGDHSEFFLKKVKPAMGSALLDAFDNKYGSQWVAAANGHEKATIQRKAGAFLKLVLTGAAVNIDSLTNHILQPIERLRFFVYAVLPNVRNERFHGLNFSSYRSSAAKMKTYAAGYFLLLIAYFLLLHVFLYRGFNVIDPAEVNSSVLANSQLYAEIFGQFVGD
jgi:hypothetical protein